MNQYKQNLLKSLIDSDPANSSKTDQEVYDWLNDPVISVSRGDKQTFTTIMHDLGVDTGYAIIEKFKTIAGSDPKTAFILDLMDPSKGGIDLSHPESVGFIDEVLAGGGITQADADNLKSVGISTVSRAVDAGINQEFNVDLVSKVRAQ